MNTELMEALTILEKEKNISRDVMMDAIENSLISACKNHFGTAENIKVIMDRETCDYAVYAEKEVVEEVLDPALEISLEDAEEIDSSLHIGDIAQVPVQSKEFGRIATQNAKNLILQKIREEDLITFIKIEFSRVGADTSITPREVIRDFIELLDILYQNPDADIEKLLSSDGFSFSSAAPERDTDEEYAEFEI